MRLDIVFEDKSAERARGFVLGGQFGQDESQIVVKVGERVELLQFGLDGALRLRVGRLGFFKQLNDLMEAGLFRLPCRRRRRRRSRHRALRVRQQH